MNPKCVTVLISQVSTHHRAKIMQNLLKQNVNLDQYSVKNTYYQIRKSILFKAMLYQIHCFPLCETYISITFKAQYDASQFCFHNKTYSSLLRVRWCEITSDWPKFSRSSLLRIVLRVRFKSAAKEKFRFVSQPKIIRS